MASLKIILHLSHPFWYPRCFLKREVSIAASDTSFSPKIIKIFWCVQLRETSKVFHGDSAWQSLEILDLVSWGKILQICLLPGRSNIFASLFAETSGDSDLTSLPGRLKEEETLFWVEFSDHKQLIATLLGAWVYQTTSLWLKSSNIIFPAVISGMAFLYMAYVIYMWVFLSRGGVRKSYSVSASGEEATVSRQANSNVSWRLVWAPWKEVHPVWGLQGDFSEPKLSHTLPAPSFDFVIRSEIPLLEIHLNW